MSKLNYFNYGALAVLFILIITVLLRGMLNGRRNRYYLYILVIGFLGTVFDIAAVTLDNSGGAYVTEKYIAHGGYLILRSLAIPVFITYLVELTGREYKIKRNMFHMVLLSFPFLCVFLCTLLSPLTHMIYYLDENNRYTHGAWFVLLYLSAAGYLLFGVYGITRYRKLFDMGQIIAVIGILAAIPTASFIHHFNPAMRMEMFTQAMSALLIMTMIQRPEERLDAVTGFNKYAAFTSDMSQVFFNGKSIRLILARITNYKWLNDLLGYVSMNELLRLVAVRIKVVNSAGGIHADAYHFGRGLFGLTIESGHFAQVEDFAEALHQSLSEGFALNQMDIQLETQICVIRCPEDIAEFQMLLSFCNEFEWQNNLRGVLHASEILQKGNYEILHHMDTIIGDALINKKFSVYYQPIYSVKDGKFRSAEALLRLQDDNYGFISPEIFIPAAERNGTIHRIGAYVLEEVCRFIAEDDFDSLGLDYIEVNLSSVQCMRNDLVQEVTQILEKYNVPPERINMEITETAAAYAQNIMLDNINELAAAGFAISLDDFGTGYSNMQRVASLPLHIVKLDKTFTNIEGSSKMEIVVSNIVRMIKDMDLQIVAEGIETMDMVRQFSDLDCEYIQGFYYSKPLPKDEFVEFIRQRIET